MKKTIIASVVSLLLIAGGVVYIKKKGNNEYTNEKCCSPCSKEGEVKYYSVVTEVDTCGESCINPKLAWIYKIFEKNMVLAEDKNCESLGFTNYIHTESHGVFPLKVKVDMYK